MRFFANGARGKLLALLLGTSLLLAGCEETIKAKTSDVLIWVEETSDEFFDNHEYIEIPWHIFLTKEDIKILNQPSIPLIDAIEFGQYNIVEVVDHINGLVEEMSPYLHDFELYEKNIADKSAISDSLIDILGHDETDVVFIEQLEDMYSRSHTYPERLDMVALEQQLVDGEHKWIVDLEWKALQDSNEFLIYPISIELNDDYKFTSSSSKNPFSSPVYTKRFDNQSVISNQSHLQFLDTWEDFARVFDNKAKNSDGIDNSHIATLVRDGLDKETLNSLFEASRGYLSNGSFTSWKMDDKEADALSYYTFSVPVDYDGTIATYGVVYSRPYERIESIQLINQ